MYKYLLFVVCVLVSVDVKMFADSLQLVTAAGYSYEEQQCLMLGGVCTKDQECADTNRLQSNSNTLCNTGSVCCDHVPPSPFCRQNGGECFAKDRLCRETQTITGVTDCKEGEKCCLLLK